MCVGGVQMDRYIDSKLDMCLFSQPLLSEKEKHKVHFLLDSTDLIIIIFRLLDRKPS